MYRQKHEITTNSTSVEFDMKLPEIRNRKEARSTNNTIGTLQKHNLKKKI